MATITKKSVRILCAVLAGLMAISCFTACGNGDDSSETTAAEAVTEAATEATTQDEAQIALDAIGEIDYGGETFTALYQNDIHRGKTEVYVERGEEEEVTSDVVLSDAVFERNTLFAELCNLEYLGMETSGGEVVSKVRQEIQSNSGDFQLISTNTTTAASLATEKLLYNYLDLGIEFDGPWWNQGTASFNINDQVYFMHGSFNFTDDCSTYVMIFNKDNYENLGYELPYQNVLDGKWTLDSFNALIQDFSADKDGNGEYDDKDAYGFVCVNNYSENFFYGSGLRYTNHSADEEPSVALDKSGLDKTATLLEKVRSFYHDGNVSYSAPFTTAVEMFKENRGLFYGEVASYVINLNKEFEGAFGVLPVPKYDEKQDNYYTRADGYGSAFALPANVKKANLMGDMMEMFAILSHQYVYPAFYNVVLTTKSTQDPQSIKMLDIVFQNRVYDLAMYFGFGMQGLFAKSAEGNANTFASEFKSVGSARKFSQKSKDIFKNFYKD